MDDKINSIRKALSNGTGSLIVWGFRVFLIAVFFWFKAEFVTKDEYLKDQSKQVEQWTGLTRSLTHIDDTLSTSDKAIDDQEKRIRELERIHK